MPFAPIFSTRKSGSTIILEVHGKVSDLADSSALNELDHMLEQVQDPTVTNVIVDFGQSPYFGSSLLETLRRIWNDIHPRQGKMVLCNVSPVGREILQIAKFDQLWPVVETCADAEKKLQTTA
jgi:anti-anti-sigma factor